MLDKFLALLERFVVAHELIAANSAKQSVVTTVTNHTEEAVRIKGTAGDAIHAAIEAADKEVLVEGEDVIDTKPARKTRQAKPKDEPKGPDLAALREEIKTIANHIAAGESDECADLFDELLENYKVRTVPKLLDEDVEAFHAEAKKLVAKYYEMED